MDPYSPLPYILIIVLILLGAFFSGSETAFSNCNPYKIKVWADDGNKRAKIASFIIKKFDGAIMAILIATNILHVATSIIASNVAIKLLNSTGLGSVIATIVTTVLIFMFGEILPKNIAKANSDKFAINASFFIVFFMIIFIPIILIFNFIIFIIKKIIGRNDQEEEFTEDDFQDAVDKKSHDGEIDEEESDIIIAAVDFTEMLVSDVLTKRDKIVALDISKCNNKYLLNYIQKVNYSRIPVYKGSIDNIIGVLHVRLYLKNYLSNKQTSVLCSIKPCYEVGPKVTLNEIFNGFKEHKTHIAIVKDKKKTIGMVTMKDVLEELVDDIDEIGTSDELGE